MRPGERIPLHDHRDFLSGGLVASSTVVTSVGGGTSAAPSGAAEADFERDLPASLLRFKPWASGIASETGDADTGPDAFLLIAADGGSATLQAFSATQDAYINVQAGALSLGAVAISAGTISATITDTDDESKHTFAGGWGIVLPSLADDPAGSASEAGQVYFNTDASEVRWYDGANWIGLFSGALDDLTDVNAPTPVDGDALTWEASSSAWVPVHAVTEDDVIALITPDVYACASLTVISAKGSIATGTHTDLHAVGGTTVQVNETNTTPGFNIEAAFTGVDGITDLHVHGYYDAAHTVTVELYNYDTTSWDVAITMPTSQTRMGLLSASIADGSPYFDGGGNAVVRFYHSQAGNPTHRLYLDYLALSHAVSTGGALALDGLTDVNAPSPNNGDVLTWDSTPGEWIPVAPGAGSGDTVGQFVAGWDGGGAELTAGTQVDVVAPFDGTITGWTLLADQTGDAVVDVWVEQLADYPPTNADSITAAAPPTLTAHTDATSTSVGTWTATITAGDILRFNLDSATDVTRLVCVIDYTRP